MAEDRRPSKKTRLQKARDQLIAAGYTVTEPKPPEPTWEEVQAKVKDQAVELLQRPSFVLIDVDVQNDHQPNPLKPGQRSLTGERWIHIHGRDLDFKPDWENDGEERAD